MIEKLRERASKSEPDKADFSSLADQVEEFTLRFMDPLKYENLPIRRFFSVNPGLNVILETAIKLKQKKVIFFYYRRGHSLPSQNAGTLDMERISAASP